MSAKKRKSLQFAEIIKTLLFIWINVHRYIMHYKTRKTNEQSKVFWFYAETMH